MPRISVADAMLGPSNPQISRTLDAERTYNEYIQPATPGVGRTAGALVVRPALVPFAQFAGQGRIRCLFELNNRAFVVGTTGYAEFFSDGTFGTVHTVANDNLPAYIISNGSAGDQNLITAGRKGYVHDLSTDAFAQITDPDFPSIVHQCEFFDGYGLVWSGGGSTQFQWSGLEDFSTWDPLDVAQRSTASDSINGFLRIQRTLMLFGTRTTEPWYDTGDPTTIFAPTGSVLVEIGLRTTYSLVRADNTAYWFGLNADGQRVIYKFDGMTPKRVSTWAVEYSLQKADTPFDAVAFTFQLNGHYYYVLILQREIDASWIYDIGLDRWYQWGHWDSTDCVWNQFRGWSHCLAFEKCLIGDRLSGWIYELRTDVYTDGLM